MGGVLAGIWNDAAYTVDWWGSELFGSGTNPDLSNVINQTNAEITQASGGSAFIENLAHSTPGDISQALTAAYNQASPSTTSGELEQGLANVGTEIKAAISNPTIELVIIAVIAFLIFKIEKGF